MRKHQVESSCDPRGLCLSLRKSFLQEYPGCPNRKEPDSPPIP